MGRNTFSNEKAFLARRLAPWLPAGAYMLTIFVLSSFPSPETVRRVPVFYHIKLIHVFEYGILAMLCGYATRRTWDLSRWLTFWLPVMLAIAYGVTDELHQALVPERTCRASDLISNSLGALGFQGFYSLMTSAIRPPKT